MNNPATIIRRIRHLDTRHPQPAACRPAASIRHLAACCPAASTHHLAASVRRPAASIRHLAASVLVAGGCAAGLLLAACTAEAPMAPNGSGSLRLTLADISTAVTRATPAQLGAPDAATFHLTITSEAGRDAYDGTFTTDAIELPTGTYTVAATCGYNATLAIDKPYYVATTTATVSAGESTDVALTATVGNALVSAIFGTDDTERQRFDRFYSDYALYVAVGTNAIPITRDDPTRSIYVRAGEAVGLRFWGKLRLESDREVTIDLDATDMPASLAAAEHAIVTLTLPDPESAALVDIAKVQVQELTLDETIPLSWLPVATVVPMHQYDDDGTLLGTNLLITDSYPGMKWRAVINNAAGTTVRAMEGTGALQSYFYNNADTWPYLPQGNYEARYYIFDNQDNATFASSRTFAVPAPTITATATAYTSYSKYLDGDITAANACEPLTVYEPTVAMNVAPALLRNDNYTYTFTYTYDGTTAAVPAGANNYTAPNLTQQEVRRQAHTLRTDAAFDGVSATAEQQVFVTGLPYTLNLAQHDEWTQSGGVDWYENDVRLGHLSTGSQYIQTTSAVCIPPATRIAADYSINVHTLTVGTYFSLQAGNIEILRQEEGGTPFRDTDHLYSGTTSTFSDADAYITTIRCYNDYGAGQTCSHIYSLTIKYAN